MIRKNVILFKLNQLKDVPELDIIEEAVSRLDLSGCTCSDCGRSGNLRIISTYQRQVVTVQDGRRLDTYVSIPLAHCGYCRRTHAVIPDNLIPYNSYSLRFILTVLMRYLKRSCPVRELCSEWQIAVSTLYAWIGLFISHFHMWCSAMDDAIRLSERMFDKILSIPAFPKVFFESFRFSFLQRCPLPGSLSCHALLPDPAPA